MTSSRLSRKARVEVAARAVALVSAFAAGSVGAGFIGALFVGCLTGITARTALDLATSGLEAKGAAADEPTPPGGGEVAT